MVLNGRAGRELATLLAKSGEYKLIAGVLPPGLIPATEDAAYAVQRETIAQMNTTVGAWKVGAPSYNAPARGSPLPSTHVFRQTPCTLPFGNYPNPGLELEIAFIFGRGFQPSKEIYSEAEVLDGIQSVAPAIEILSSRFKEWPAVDKLLQLADLQNNGALIVGEAVPYQPNFSYLAPQLTFAWDGQNISKENPCNPAGDPRRLLTWLVNHCASTGVPIEEGTIVTTGTYTGAYFCKKPGTAIGKIEGLPPIQLTLA